MQIIVHVRKYITGIGIRRPRRASTSSCPCRTPWGFDEASRAIARPALCVEGGTDLLGPRRAFVQSLSDASLVEAPYGGSPRLAGAITRASFPVGALAPRTNEKNVTTA